MEARLEGRDLFPLPGGRRRAEDPGLDQEDDCEQEPQEPDELQTVGVDRIIPVHGVLGKHLSELEMMCGGCDVDTVSQMIDLAMGDQNVKRLIFDFRSPGGEVTGIPELAAKIAAITSKETIAFTDSLCCSAALWLAEQCHHFVVTPSSQVGSIGVWCAYMDSSGAMEKAGQRMQAISAGKYKLMGAYWKPLTDEERAMLQASVDSTYAEFKEAVNVRRVVDDKYMQGQVFDGDEAVEYGIADATVQGLHELLSDYQDNS